MFVDYDINHPEYAEKFKQLGGGGIPVILINNKKIRGFRESELLEEIGKLK